MKCNKLRNTAVNLLFPPECIICGERINVTCELSKINCICKRCRPSYESIFSEVCPLCNRSVSTCTCGVRIGSAEISPLAKCFFYKPKKERFVGNSVIYAIKHTDDKRITEMMALELSRSLTDMMRAENIDPCECIFTFVPRRKRAIRKDGFDQGRRLANYCATFCGVKRGAKPLFVRSSGREQKKLNALRRRKNITESIRVRNGAEKRICGRTVCIVDDVVTSGATMKAAEKLLLEAGAERVIFACVAKTKNE